MLCGYDRNRFIQFIGVISGIYNPEMRQLKVIDGNAHGTGCPRGIAVFAFEPVTFTGNGDQEIEFGAPVGCPETGTPRIQA